MTKSVDEAIKEADLLIVLTDWDEFKEMDLENVKKLMKSPNVVDGRNMYSKEKMGKIGFNYIGVGR